MNYTICKKGTGTRGIATLELAFILPIMMLLAFAVIDFGRLIHARLIITNVSREGGSLASRDLKSANDLLNMLIASGHPLDLSRAGKIYITKIAAGSTSTQPKPVIASQVNKGSLAVGSAIANNKLNMGLSAAIYNHLVFKAANQTSDLSDVTVVEVYYLYTPITPLPNFINGVLLEDGNGQIIGSKTVM